ncbi:MAG: hypothetical protein CM15mP75_0060 [Flammeovirgaceae bacterium]|nr:MAG: hypothetical protein CM15mP75_0060 [Flammeovirgaceae bacterium]
MVQNCGKARNGRQKGGGKPRVFQPMTASDISAVRAGFHESPFNYATPPRWRVFYQMLLILGGLTPAPRSCSCFSRGRKRGGTLFKKSALIKWRSGRGPRLDESLFIKIGGSKDRGGIFKVSPEKPLPWGEKGAKFKRVMTLRGINPEPLNRPIIEKMTIFIVLAKSVRVGFLKFKTFPRQLSRFVRGISGIRIRGLGCFPEKEKGGWNTSSPKRERFRVFRLVLGHPFTLGVGKGGKNQNLTLSLSKGKPGEVPGPFLFVHLLKDAAGDDHRLADCGDADIAARHGAALQISSSVQPMRRAKRTWSSKFGP